MNMTGAIFDLDGTLLDSMRIWDTIGEDYLLSRGIRPRENLREVFRSMSLQEAAEYYIEHYGLTESPKEIMEGVDAMIGDFYLREAKVKPGVAEFLEKLRAAGVKLCIATATDRRLTEEALRRKGILSFFSGMLTCGEIGRGKSEPDIFLAALRLLGTERERTVVFEDALHAVRTAKAAGFPVAAVEDPSSEADREAIRAEADWYFATMEEAEVLLR